MLRPGSLPSRIAALGLLGLVVVGGYALVVVPVMSAFQENGEAIERAETLLQRQRALADQRPLLEERLGEQQEQAETVAGYLEGPSDALAAAQLQDRVKDVVEAAGGELRSTRILPAEPIDASPGTRRTALRVQMIVSIAGLAEVLYDLEEGQPYIMIDELSVRNQRERRRRRRNAPDTGEPKLDVSLQLSGFVREVSA
ncbi:MAG: type II secretion system protein GspM [Pseudomonadota bacterium]